jgi:hypothetical protein
MSFVVDRSIVVERISLIAEKIEAAESNTKASIMKINNGNNERGAKYVGNFKFKIVLNGIAKAPGSVADLICSLEDSEYFKSVYPSYSRNKQIKAVSENKEYEVSEFEIRFYLANYEVEKKNLSAEADLKKLDKKNKSADSGEIQNAARKKV